MIAPKVSRTTVTIRIPEPSLLRDAATIAVGVAVNALIACGLAVLLDHLLRSWSLATKAITAALVPPVAFSTLQLWSYSAAEWPRPEEPNFLPNTAYIALVASGLAGIASARFMLLRRKQPQ